MSDKRDWDKELAEIDRLLGAEPAKELPAPPAPTAPKQGQVAAASSRPAAPAAPRPVPAAVGPVRTWLVALLGPIGAAALAVWPYPNECGNGLMLYLVGVLAILGAAIWTMR